MAAPSPERIVELLVEIERLRHEIEHAYRWLDGAAHSQAQRSGERVHGGAGPSSGGPTAAVGLSGRGERILAGKRVTTLHASTSDYVRRKQESAGANVTKATAALRGAASELARAFARIQDDADRDLNADPVPRQEEPWVIDQLRGAQGRRTARGEVYAEDALPVPDTEYPTHRFAGKGLLCRQCGETPEHPVHTIDKHEFVGFGERCRDCQRKVDDDVHAEAA